jgi:hypothetical protein
MPSVQQNFNFYKRLVELSLIVSTYRETRTRATRTTSGAEELEKDARIDRAEELGKDARVDHAEEFEKDAHVDRAEELEKDACVDRAEELGGRTRRPRAGSRTRRPIP